MDEAVDRSFWGAVCGARGSVMMPLDKTAPLTEHVIEEVSQ